MAAPLGMGPSLPKAATWLSQREAGRRTIPAFFRADRYEYNYLWSQFMFERFTDRARLVMATACFEAYRWHHEYLGTEHLLVSLVRDPRGVGSQVLKSHSMNEAQIRASLGLANPPSSEPTSQRLPQSDGMKQVIKYACQEAERLGREYVGTECLLIGLLIVTDDSAAVALTNAGLGADDVREEVKALLLAGIEDPEGNQW
ncbi:MAG: hypothetical protein JSU68_08620 [Phycisphaerales bacterium]|nr:MAG: hypothetical protein JSU68_08620 [Phycisphaerales bacterium]